MKKKAFELTTLIVILLIASCSTYQPPDQIKSATSVMNGYTPEYVTEANKALAESNHPEAERLIGIGLRLQRAIEALDQWANSEEEEK